MGLGQVGVVHDIADRTGDLIHDRRSVGSSGVEIDECVRPALPRKVKGLDAQTTLAEIHPH